MNNKVYIKFGVKIKNFTQVMKGKGNSSIVMDDGKGETITFDREFQVDNPIFATPSYVVKTTLNHQETPEGEVIYGNCYFTGEDPVYSKFTGKNYQRLFRKSVLWDFGDGYRVEGFSGEHYYSAPGKYKITCKLFDVDSKMFENVYSVYVVVKEVIPTKIEFSSDEKYNIDEDNFVESIYCSKLEKIADLDIFLTNTSYLATPIAIKRIDDNVNNEKSYIDLLGETLPPYPHLSKYYSFFFKNENYFNKSTQYYETIFEPVDSYTPSYEYVYGRFYLDENNQIDFDGYIISENDKEIKIHNPNLPIMSEKNDDYEYKIVKLKAVSTIEELIEKKEVYYYCGAISNIEIYYKNDFYNDRDPVNSFSVFFDWEKINSKNYLNTPGLGFNLEIKPNIDVKIDWIYNMNGIIDDLSLAAGVDVYVRKNLVNYYDFPCFLIPYVGYKFIDSTGEEKLDYYIPKDIVIDKIEFFDIAKEAYDVLFEHDKLDAIKVTENISKDIIEDETIVLKDNKVTVSKTIISRFEDENLLDNERKLLENDFIKNLKYLAYVSFRPKNNINVLTRVTSANKTYYIENFVDKLTNLSNTKIPHEKYVNVNVNELIETYTPHPLFDNKVNLKSFLYNVFANNNCLSYILTKNEHFFDDYINYDTMYVKSLVELLKMIGIEITEYENTTFDGVNEIRDFARMLTMNHSRLVGNLVIKDLDIYINTLENKGENVADKLKPDDIICVDYKTRKIKGVIRDKIRYNIPEASYYDYIAIREDYSKDTYPVNIKAATDAVIALKRELGEEVPDENGVIQFSINEYPEDGSWNWYLNLPIEYSGSADLKNNILNRYYSFFLIDPYKLKTHQFNFVDESFLNGFIADFEIWSQKYGYTYDILNKIIIEKLNFYDTSDLSNSEKAELEDINYEIYNPEEDEVFITDNIISETENKLITEINKDNKINLITRETHDQNS